jgi:hypothetical protein
MTLLPASLLEPFDKLRMTRREEPMCKQYLSLAALLSSRRRMKGDVLMIIILSLFFYFFFAKDHFLNLKSKFALY